MIANVITGDAEDVLAQSLPQVHLTFTSPPYYNARGYSQFESYREYLGKLHNIFELVHELTYEGRFLVVNTSPVIEPREKRSKSSNRYAIPFDLHCLLKLIGWEFIDDIVWVKPEASVKQRIGGFLQHRKPLGYKPNPITEYLMVYRKKTDRLIDWNMKQYPEDIIEQSKISDDFPTNNVWKISPKSSKDHPAVFPQELADNVIKLYSYKGDIVLDPFCGSGTTLVSAIHLGRRGIGIEKNDEYTPIIHKRVQSAIEAKRQKPLIK